MHTLPLPARPDGLRGPPGRALAATLPWRPDIEGLRGVAVLSVLAVHAFPDWVRSGFVGVDIFFVLSGFLISRIVFEDAAASRFSFSAFYAARARRLLPALVPVLLVVIVVAVMLATPADLKRVGGHVAAAALFVSNVASWREAGYFDAASVEKPLLHLWSLGIEEQFYVCWPIVALALVRRPRWAWPAIGGAVLGSFALNVGFVASRPTGTFYLPPTRFWELLVGAALAWATRASDPRAPTATDGRPGSAPWSASLRPALLSWSGLLAILLAMALIDRTDHFPGWWALLPTAGTVALLAAGPDAPVNRSLLAGSVLRFYGRISYPLYLWHWPLLSLPVLVGLAMTEAMRVAALVGSVVLATLTHVLLERPIRFGARRRPALLLLCGSLAGVGLMGWSAQATDGFVDAYPPAVRQIALAGFDYDYADYRIDRCFLRLEQGPEHFASECAAPDGAERPLVLLWGDSHAASLYPGLAALLREPGDDRRLAQYTAARCPPLVHAPRGSSAPCARTTAFVLGRLAELHPSLVVLAADWSRYGAGGGARGEPAAELRATLARLRTLGVERVVVVGQLPLWTRPQPALLLSQWRRSGRVPVRDADDVEPLARSADELIRDATMSSGATFVSPLEALCHADGCLASLEEDGVFLPFAHDRSHLTAAGSIELVRRLRAALAG
jgi:peptidoglycan/LPS O-acetylase OafA/YrhL